VSCAKTAEPIEMSFGMLSPVDSRNHVAYIDGETDPLWEGAILRGRACEFDWSFRSTPWVKKGATLTMAITLSILGGFAKFFHCCKEQ